MIEASASTQDLIQRLRQRAAKVAAGFLAERRADRTPARGDWRSAKALWPDIFGENQDGK